MLDAVHRHRTTFCPRPILVEWCLEINMGKRVNRDDSERRPGARGFDGKRADASADVEKRYRDVGLWNRLERLRADRQTLEKGPQ